MEHKACGCCFYNGFLTEETWVRSLLQFSTYMLVEVMWYKTDNWKHFLVNIHLIIRIWLCFFKHLNKTLPPGWNSFRTLASSSALCPSPLSSTSCCFLHFPHLSRRHLSPAPLSSLLVYSKQVWAGWFYLLWPFFIHGKSSLIQRYVTHLPLLILTCSMGYQGLGVRLHLRVCAFERAQTMPARHSISDVW